MVIGVKHTAELLRFERTAPKHFIPDRLDSTGILIGGPEPTTSPSLYRLNCLIPLHPLPISQMPTPAFLKAVQ